MTVREDLAVLGKTYGPRQAGTMTDLVTEAGRTGSKRDAKRLAQAAGVSVDFVRGTKRYAIECVTNRKVYVYTKRERLTLLKLLAVLGKTEEEFLALAAGRNVQTVVEVEL